MRWQAALLWLLGGSATSNEHFLVVCSKVSHEEAHLIEWIEFHRLQGIDKFSLYYEAAPGDRHASLSASRLWLLKDFYEQLGLGNLIEIQATGNLLWESLNGFKHVKQVWHDYHRVAQNGVYGDCIRRYHDRAEWVITLDADEFLYVHHEAKATLRDFFHTFGHHVYEMYRNGTYPLIESGMLPSTLHEAMSTELENQMTQRAGEWIQYAANGTLAGIHATGIPFGSAGVFWEHHNMLVKDLVSNQIQLTFDPRDHVRFRAYQDIMTDSEKAILTGYDLKGFLAEVRNIRDRWHREENLNKDWEAEAVDGINVITQSLLNQLLRANDSQEIFDFYRHKLHMDYPNEWFQPLIVPDVSDEVLDEFTDLLKEHLVAHHDDPLTPVRLDRLYEIYTDVWAQFYPITIEYGVWRAPCFTMGDPLEETYALVERHFPVCAEYLAEVRRLDAEYPNVLEPPAPTIEPPHPMCIVGRRGPPYLDYTQMGKTAYWVGDWRRKEGKRSMDDLRLFFDGYVAGCPSPWIHHCGFRHEDNSTISRSNPLYELRIDHHSFRSFFKRSIGYSPWRKEHLMGFVALRGEDTIEYEKFVNSIRDKGANIWLPELRESIRKLRPLPKYLPKELKTDPIVILNKQSQSRPVFGELLLELRAQCSADRPYVGLALPSHPSPPSPVIMGGHCVRAKKTRNDVKDVVPADPEMCAGFPEISCVDRLPDGSAAMLIDSLSSYTVRNTSRFSWFTPSVCVNCARVEETF
eukprot:Blabericola_migrator_1__9601@NODE_523_length_7872_cov_140_842409_g400_i0_p1_GENE_NODE_523_length_7872_cov_140_842409_g400_i0NODE_523_length_7872_cov_140_842409_g400_i0_p1_ORF_typecomplete_len747_score117_26Glyco_transf_92/PF01697_27/2_7e18Glyco_transf_92/PF01697_27/8_7e03Glyco_tranf_2_4/PF13704_6/3_2e06Glyco_tranf_2_4/PF13704_6/1_7e04_NODE_523_length_7872_cov_140_842409_g400_i035325772